MAAVLRSAKLLLVGLGVLAVALGAARDLDAAIMRAAQTRGEHIRERMQERAERAICAGRRSELFGAYLVRSVRDGNGADP